jgi:hypothetical protein
MKINTVARERCGERRSSMAIKDVLLLLVGEPARRRLLRSTNAWQKAVAHPQSVEAFEGANVAG